MFPLSVSARASDIRHLDWKVWSKTDEYYIKQYEEETNLRCHMVVDVSNSMHYGSGPMDKYNYGCTIAACPLPSSTARSASLTASLGWSSFRKTSARMA